MSQLIISIGREFGSGGHEIAEKLAKHYDLPMYDHNMLREIASFMNVDADALHAYDETKKQKFFSRTVRGMSSCPATNVAQLQFKFIETKANMGESFVIVGRCAETVLKDNPNTVSLFILADRDVKAERVMKLYSKDKKGALALMDQHDKYRKQYHNDNFPGKKWGDSRNYHLSVNSSKLGIDETVKFIISYIDACRANSDAQ